MRVLRGILIGLGGLAVLVTALPLIPTNESLVRDAIFSVTDTDTLRLLPLAFASQ